MRRDIACEIGPSLAEPDESSSSPGSIRRPSGQIEQAIHVALVERGGTPHRNSEFAHCDAVSYVTTGSSAGRR